MVHKFSSSYDVGKKGENLFLKHNPGILAPFIGGTESDVIYLLKTPPIPGEIKTDQYDLNKTPNFFMERYSNNITYAPGGPWQALEKGSQFFIYYFKQNFKYFLFDDTTYLVKCVKHLVDKHKLKLIPVENENYITLGYKVRRKWLEEFYIKEHHITEKISL